MPIATVGGLMGNTTGGAVSYRFAFNGTDQDVQIPGWVPLGAYYTIGVSTDQQNLAPSGNDFIISAPGINQLRWNSASGNVQFQYARRSDGATTTVETPQPAPNVEAKWEITWDGEACEMFLDGVSVDVATDMPRTVGASPIDAIGEKADTNRFQGTIWGLNLLDRTGLHGRKVVDGDGVNYIKLAQPITLGGNFTVEFEYTRRYGNVGGTSSQRILGTEDGLNRIQINDPANGSQPDGFIIYLSGAARNYSGEFINIDEGQTCKVKVVRSSGNTINVYVDDVLSATVNTSVNDFVIEQLYGASSDTKIMTRSARLGNVSITDDDTGDTWFYALDEDV